MKMLWSLAVAATAAFALPAPVEARDGCGPRFHRGAYGRCVPNVRGYYRGPGIGRGYYGAPRSGYWYRGRGWYDGNRYWQHRYRDRGYRGWRYR